MSELRVGRRVKIVCTFFEQDPVLCWATLGMTGTIITVEPTFVDIALDEEIHLQREGKRSTKNLWFRNMTHEQMAEHLEFLD